MRKRILSPHPDETTTSPGGDGDWLDLDALATVEVTSEDPAYPVERALLGGEAGGWRASAPGEQTIRILFDAPRRLRRIAIRFVEEETPRTQELRIGWSGAGGASGEIVRQQYNFDPRGAVREDEDYRVELDAVTSLEIAIRPDISGGAAVASLASLRLA